MMAVRNGFSEKKDLHVGGLGANARTSPATLADPGIDAADAISQRYLMKARDVVESANRVLRDNPLAAVGLVAALGLTVGFLLSRRS